MSVSRRRTLFSCLEGLWGLEVRFVPFWIKVSVSYFAFSAVFLGVQSLVVDTPGLPSRGCLSAQERRRTVPAVRLRTPLDGYPRQRSGSSRFGPHGSGPQHSFQGHRGLDPGGCERMGSEDGLRRDP